jgi:single-strand DNA-binding protein
MALSSTVTLVGNLTRDPELRFTNSGMAVATCGVAVNFRRQRQGEWEEETSFFDVTIFGDMGENAAESLHKGNRVVVTGRLQQRSWETQDGDKRSKVEIVADEIAPSLRWATAEVKRSERREGGGGGDGGGGNGRPVANSPSDGGGSYDEEPF